MDYSKNVPVRNSSLDLLRIISMVMVIILHFFSHGGVLAALTPHTSHWFIGHVINYVSFVAVNCFVLISGYFLLTSQFQLKKVLAFEAQLLFYAILCLLVGNMLAVIKFERIMLFRTLFPTTSRLYWFATNYMALYILAPFLNKFINSLDKAQMKACILSFVVLFSLLPSLNFTVDAWNVNRGYSFLWFVVLYFTGAYIRLHHQANHASATRWKYELGYLCCVGLAILIKLYFPNISISWFGSDYTSSIIAYNGITMFFGTVFLFMFFYTIKIKNDKLSKIISEISQLTFGIYLIHEFPYTRNFIWNTLFSPSTYANTVRGWILLIVYVAIIFLSGIAVEFIRKKAFGRIQGKVIDLLYKLVKDKPLILTMEHIK